MTSDLLRDNNNIIYSYMILITMILLYDLSSLYCIGTRYLLKATSLVFLTKFKNFIILINLFFLENCSKFSIMCTRLVRFYLSALVYILHT